MPLSGSSSGHNVTRLPSSSSSVKTTSASSSMRRSVYTSIYDPRVVNVDGTTVYEQAKPDIPLKSYENELPNSEVEVRVSL